MRIKEEPKIQAVVRECYEIAAALKKADPAYYEIFAWLNQEFRRRLKSRTLLVEILRAAKNNHARGQRPVDMWKYFSGIARSLERARDTERIRRGEPTRVNDILARAYEATKK